MPKEDVLAYRYPELTFQQATKKVGHCWPGRPEIDWTELHQALERTYHFV